MNVSGRLQRVVERALAESMDVHTMTTLARRLFGSYDLNERTGFPKNLAIPNKNAAGQIVRDIREKGLFLDFVTLLIQIHEVGLKGRKYRIPYLREIVDELKKEGLVFDEATRTFFEDPGLRKSRDWGVLREGVEYFFTFLRVDIVGNTNLVRRNSSETVQNTYEYLRGNVQGTVERRNGRIWNWEGDGGLAVFHFSNMENRAALCAMEILNELYIYNLTQCELNDPLSVRIAVHCGPCEYRKCPDELNGETIKTVNELESKLTKPNAITFSGILCRGLSPVIVERLERVSDDASGACYSYEIRWEN